jgi:hypothetical protein
MPVAQRKRKDAPERQPGHVRLLQAEPMHEAGQAVGVAGHAKRFWRIGCATGPGGIPGDDRELVGEFVQLPPPARWAVAHIAVQQDQWRSSAGALVGDAEPLDLDLVHEHVPATVSTRHTFAQMGPGAG